MAAAVVTTPKRTRKRESRVALTAVRYPRRLAKPPLTLPECQNAKIVEQNNVLRTMMTRVISQKAAPTGGLVSVAFSASLYEHELLTL
jgi:hypothetical protein